MTFDILNDEPHESDVWSPSQRRFENGRSIVTVYYWTKRGNVSCGEYVAGDVGYSPYCGFTRQTYAALKSAGIMHQGRVFNTRTGPCGKPVNIIVMYQCVVKAHRWRYVVRMSVKEAMKQLCSPYTRLHVNARPLLVCSRKCGFKAFFFYLKALPLLYSCAARQLPISIMSTRSHSCHRAVACSQAIHWS